MPALPKIAVNDYFVRVMGEIIFSGVTRVSGIGGHVDIW